MSARRVVSIVLFNGHPLAISPTARPRGLLRGQAKQEFGRAGGDMSKRVLVVDDEPNILLSLEFLMAQAGYEVSTAADGEAALQAIEAARPDVVLLDVNIPKRNGYQVCETIRANPAWGHVRVVMITAKGRDVEREKGLALGADDYIIKPFSTHEVVAKVAEVLAP